MVNCPYGGCKLRCRSKHAHRAKYAYISAKWKEKVIQLHNDTNDNNNSINYEALKKLLWPLQDIAQGIAQE